MDIFAEQQNTGFDVDLNEMHKDLNPMQREAAMVKDGPCMVVASAGAGKTKTLIHRVATLIAEGVPPTNIMVVTFTTKAAEEIKARLQGMVGDHSQHITAGTFHSVVYQKMLKMYPDSKSLRELNIDTEKCGIMDEDDSKKIMKEVIKSFSKEDQQMAKDMQWTDRNIYAQMSYERSMGRDIEAFRSTISVGDEDEEFKRFTYRVWGLYNQKCRESHGIDFDDILLIVDYMLRQEPHIAEELSRQFRYLMLDEYQDTNRVQMSIMDSIAKHHENIFVVGDEKQSIYMFRAADITVMLGFQKRYPKAKMVNMNGNYRSKSRILTAANASAAAMPNKLTDGQVQAMQDNADEGGVVNIVEFKDDDTEADMICKAVMRDLKAGVDPNEISILYRQRSIRKKLEEQLVMKKVPYRVVGDRSFFQRKEVRDAVSLARFVFRPWDKLAVDRVVENTRFSYSKEALNDSILENRIDAYQALRLASQETLKNSTKPKAFAARIAPFLKYAESIKTGYDYGDPADSIRDGLVHLWNLTLRPGVEAAAQKSSSGDGDLDSRLSAVKHIFDRVKNEIDEGIDIQEILEEMKMMVSSEDKMDRSSKDKINLMTMHASKGLEFENVYIMGMNNVVMPTDNIEPVEVEENRRLVYVGMTRAKKRLSISTADNILLNGQPMKTKRSDFIEEVSKGANIKVVRYQGRYRHNNNGMSR